MNIAEIRARYAADEDGILAMIPALCDEVERLRMEVALLQTALRLVLDCAEGRAHSEATRNDPPPPGGVRRSAKGANA